MAASGTSLLAMRYRKSASTDIEKDSENRDMMGK